MLSGTHIAFVSGQRAVTDRGLVLISSANLTDFALSLKMACVMNHREESR